MKRKIAIIGHGYVGKAVDFGFPDACVEKIIVDPNYGNSVDELENSVDFAFVCVPTPMGEMGEIDASIVIRVVEYLKQLDCIIVVKSTVTPDIMRNLAANCEKLVYNPEFLTERNYQKDFIKPPMHIFGGQPVYTQQLQQLYKQDSQCEACPIYEMTPVEASFVKYGINSFLATKVLFMNQLKDLTEREQANYETIVAGMKADPRIGDSHLQVPGLDGRRGFGGACFPKDSTAFSVFGQGVLSLLEEAIRANKDYRDQYDLDDREIEQNVRFASQNQ